MKKDNFMLLNDYFCVKKSFNQQFIISADRITKVFGFYENYHYLNFKTKPEQNIHQNVPNDTIFNPAKQVHSNNNYFHIKTIIFFIQN